jgi:hypothetical protein
MKFKSLKWRQAALVSLVVGLLAGGQSVFAQGYNYSYGNSRVTSANGTGLANPSSSYITSGTMSRSAQGLTAGISGQPTNNGLPQVNMGANIRTPGDNMYQPKQQVVYPQRRVNPYYYQQQPPGNYYVPGQNSSSGNRSSYGSSYSSPGYRSGSGASYSDSSTYSDYGYNR